MCEITMHGMFVLNYRCSNVLYSCVYQCVPQGDQMDKFRGSDNPPKPDCLCLCLVPIVLQCSCSVPAVTGCVATSECCCSSGKPFLGTARLHACSSPSSGFHFLPFPALNFPFCTTTVEMYRKLIYYF